MSGPRIGSLFSGTGGLDMGVQAVLGGDLAWVADIDPGACAILAHHHPDVPNLGDVSATDWATVEPVDVITGGTPCQDLSHAGRRAGMTEGTRSNLWVAMREAIAQLRPGLVIWENVRGAYSAAADSELVARPGLLDGVRRRDDREPVLRALGRVLGDLSDLGYDAVWHGLRAADVGAPHSRFRVFVTAWPRSTAAHAERGGRVRSGALQLRGSSEHASRSGATAADSDCVGREWAGSARGGSPADLSLLPTPSVADVEGGRKARSGERSDELLLNGIAATNRWGEYAAAIHRWESLLRPAPEPTQPSSKGKPQLAPAFVEFMMGLPAGHVTDPGIYADMTDRRGKPLSASAIRNLQLRALGNGVVPQQAAAALRWGLAHAHLEVSA